MRVATLIISGLLFFGCAYPRRSTSLSPARRATGAPQAVVRLALQGATLPPRDRGGQAWDDDGSGPDVFVRIVRDDDTVYESSLSEDAQQAVFGDTSPNLYLPSSSDVRIELWEKDGAIRETIVGMWRGRGLPSSALINADARLMLEGDASLQFRVLEPNAQRGTGISEYEVHSDVLRILRVIRFSPAGRVGLRDGDEVIAIDGRMIEELGIEAHGALSLASSRRSTLRVRRERNGQTREREFTLDSGFIWQTP